MTTRKRTAVRAKPYTIAKMKLELTAWERRLNDVRSPAELCSAMTKLFHLVNKQRAAMGLSTVADPVEEDEPRLLNSLHRRTPHVPQE